MKTILFVVLVAILFFGCTKDSGQQFFRYDSGLQLSALAVQNKDTTITVPSSGRVEVTLGTFVLHGNGIPFVLSDGTGISLQDAAGVIDSVHLYSLYDGRLSYDYDSEPVSPGIHVGFLFKGKNITMSLADTIKIVVVKGIVTLPLKTMTKVSVSMSPADIRSQDYVKVTGVAQCGTITLVPQ